MSFNIAIDGPAGAGKSTIAKAVAKELGFVYVDTGAMYRAIALYLLQNAVDTKDIEAVSAVLDQIEITISYENGTQKVVLNGEDVSTEIRKEEVGNIASQTSAYPDVRKKLLSLQRDLAASSNVIMDGRDIGTTILPNADIKIYLTASVSARASRRYKELVEKGEEVSLATIKEDIQKRDEQDMNREISPLRQAADAVLIDSSDLGISEVVAKIISLYEERR